MQRNRRAVYGLDDEQALAKAPDRDTTLTVVKRP